MQRFKLEDVELTDPKVVEPPGTLFTDWSSEGLDSGCVN